jgi:signal transduction histidine kinase
MIAEGADSAATWLRADRRRLDVVVAALTVGLSTLLILGSPDNYDTGWPEVAAGVGAFVMLVFRRRAPFLLLVVALIWTALHIGVYERPTQMIFAILVLVATVCVRLDRWPAIGLGVLIAGSLYLLGIISNDAELGDARAVIGIAWTAAAVGVADAVRSWRRYRESAESQIRTAVLASEAQARQQVSEERLAIARELHDLLAHNLSVMNVQTGAALHLLRADPDQAEESLTAARNAGRTVLDELRDLLAVLRSDDGEGEPTSSLPSVDELSNLVDTLRAAGLAVTWGSDGAPRLLAPAVSLAAYRIAQEALTNAAKHGDGAAQLDTHWDDTGLTIRVSNNRVGAATGDSGESGRHGLIGMRERATTNGGRLRAEAEGDRFVVDAWLPAATGREFSS